MPDYLDQLKKDIFAMIRQIGPPTLFLTLSAVETSWNPIMKCLHKMHYNKLDELRINKDYDAMESSDKIALLRLDPSTYARYYNNRRQAFQKLLLKDTSILGKVEDYVFVTEFQSRGSPHEHAMIWIENAPIYNNNNEEEMIDFVNKCISCNRDDLQPEWRDIQTHKHRKSC